MTDLRTVVLHGGSKRRVGPKSVHPGHVMNTSCARNVHRPNRNAGCSMLANERTHPAAAFILHIVQLAMLIRG
jgi:hypothetical protein